MNQNRTAGEQAGWSSYNDSYNDGYASSYDNNRGDGYHADDGHARSPREYLTRPVDSPTSTDGQFVSAQDQGFGSRAHMPASPAGFYAHGQPESGATMLDSGSSDALEKASPAKRQRRRCCGNGRYCFCFSKKCCLIFLPILAVILAGLGVTLYYVFPRIPSVTFDRVGVAQQDAEGNAAQQLLGSASINRQGVVTVPLVIHLSVSNPNYIPWTIHNVTVDGFLANSTQGGSDYPVGEGGLRAPFKMPKKTEQNDMPIYFNFRLSTDNDNYIAAAQSVQRACTAGGPNLRFRYKAKIILHAISWLGIKPTISDTISFACPISDIESLGINISDLTGLAT
ncbi:hypothetical protein LPJ70_004194 [Coemansia sp. RSA 2708]|nr:hypothetical protein LPJ70_004194 [Coemansia sp. RSA 2708]